MAREHGKHRLTMTKSQTDRVNDWLYFFGYDIEIWNARRLPGEISMTFSDRDILMSDERANTGVQIGPNGRVEIIRTTRDFLQELPRRKARYGKYLFNNPRPRSLSKRQRLEEYYNA